MLALLMMTGMLVKAENKPLNFNLTEEAYIDDIPFDTEQIAGTASPAADLTQFALKEEEYIDDIPFNTEEIVQSLQQGVDQDRAMAEIFPLDDEPYIDDISFNTGQIAMAAVQIREAAGNETARSAITPLPARENSIVGVLEILIPVMVILGTLTYAVYEYILN